MKWLFTVLFCVSVSYVLFAQKATLVRVYDLNGKKIAVGKILTTTDTSVQLRVMTGDTIDLPIPGVGKLKTRRSAGHNILVTSLAGAVALAILGAATAQPDAMLFDYSAGEGAAAGAILGLPLGAAFGGLSMLFKKVEVYPIKGNLQYWKTVRHSLSLQRR
ncbi:MAG: hypothetical protein EOO01_41505 [Chitinophagaceae bacterium]|nr:MAG: hypothetical protein EOO01_41505 [Chitinophagaceae bacterium]